jgi:hypothetical protein
VQTWAHGVDDQKSKNARISAILVGDDSLDANIGHLCAMTGGQVFYAPGDNVTSAISTSLTAMRSGPGRGSVKLSKTLPKHLAVKRAGVEVAISWLPNNTDAAGGANRGETGRWLNNGAENSHLPFRRRERAMLKFRRIQTLQKFVSVHASIQNHFNQERHLYSCTNFKLNRAAAIAEWRQLMFAWI